MIKQKLKLHASRWLGGAAAAALLVTGAYAQDSLVNIQASGIYQGGNTVIGGISFTNGSPFTEYFSLLIPPAGLTSTTYPTNNYMSAYEVINIGSTSYTNTQSSIELLSYGSATGYTGLSLFAAGNNPLAFGFEITLNTNLFSTDTSALTAPELGAILTDFQNNSPFLNWDGTDISARAGDHKSTVLNVEPAPEPSTLALASLGSLSLLLFRRRK